jgi:hypothetical protein
VAAADARAIDAYRRARASGASHPFAFNIACGIWYAHCPGAAARGVRQRLASLLARAETVSAPAKKDTTIACAAHVFAISMRPEGRRRRASGPRGAAYNDPRTAAILATADQLLDEHVRLMALQGALLARAKTLVQRTKRNLFFAAMYTGLPPIRPGAGMAGPLRP